MFIEVLLLAALQGAPAAPAQQQDPLADFLRQVNEAAEMLKPVKAEGRALLGAGRAPEFVRQLLAALPEADRPPAHDYALASLVFDLDAQASMELHRRAFERLPGNPLVGFEWALELHRAGRIAEAEAIYASLPIEKPSVPAAIHALHAETFARLGRYREACDTWQKIDLAVDHDKVQAALGWVHAPLSPWARRSELIAKVAEGDAIAARDLILLDLEFDYDPHRVEVRGDLVDADLARIRAAPGADAAGVALLEACADLRMARRAAENGEDSVAEEAARDRALDAASAAHLLGEDRSLPVDLVLADQGFEDLLTLGLVRADEVLASFGDDLWKRARARPGDARAAAILGGLYEVTDSDRAEMAWRAGWDCCGDAECAAYLLHHDEHLPPDNPILVAALAKHPDAVRLLMLSTTAWLNKQLVPPGELLTRFLVASTGDSLDVEMIDSTYGLLEKLAPPR